MPAHNTQLPLKRSPPASFKRLLDGGANLDHSLPISLKQRTPFVGISTNRSDFRSTCQARSTRLAVGESPTNVAMARSSESPPLSKLPSAQVPSMRAWSGPGTGGTRAALDSV